mmetsp:Transcript_64351/g.114613  ORF Transcript_64351/g.114613 Transcript_64351/m.114613 type:complete len:432 (-) Transcript_64351:631-1926(-)
MNDQPDLCSTSLRSRPELVRLSASDGDYDFSKAGAFEEFLDEVQNTANIQALDMSSTKLCWKHTKTLCDVLPTIEHLVELDVSDNPLGPFDGMGPLSQFLGGSPSPPLRAINCSSCDMDEEVVLSVCETIVENKILQKLSFDANQPFTIISIHAVTNLVINMVALTELSLADLQLGSDCVKVLAEAVMHSATLTSLSLEMNLIDWEGGTGLGEMLSVNKALRRLDLSCNRLRAEGISELLSIDCVERNTALTALNLSRNFCQGIDHISGLPQNLRVFNIAVNNINVPGAVKMSHLLEDPVSNLQILYLQQNLIGDDGCCVIADALNRNTTLRLLDLSENMVGVNGVMYFVQMLSYNTTLQRLHMARNPGINPVAWSLFENQADQFWGLQYLDLQGTTIGKFGELRLRDQKLLIQFDDEKSESEAEDSDDDQ